MIVFKIPDRRNGILTSAWLTVPEAAEYLGVGRKKIYQLIEGGESRAVKLGMPFGSRKKDWRNLEPVGS